MQTRPSSRRWRITTFRLLALVAAALIGSIALPAPPASAASVHRLNAIGALDIKDDDVGEDDWCRNLPMGMTLSMDHGTSRTAGLVTAHWCDEVRIDLVVRGQLMSDNRICNISVELILYEGRSADLWIDDRDGRTVWNGGTSRCLAPGGRLFWDVIRVDNTAENEPDHGWLRNFTITHFV